MTVRVGINGFGRIGRIFMRTSLGRDDFEVVAVNDLAEASTLAHLLKHDSIHGAIGAEIDAKERSLFVDGREIRVTAETDPVRLPWRELGVEIVVEATGRFRDRASAQKGWRSGFPRPTSRSWIWWPSSSNQRPSTPSTGRFGPPRPVRWRASWT